jgi:hypothetical protein
MRSCSGLERPGRYGSGRRCTPGDLLIFAEGYAVLRLNRSDRYEIFPDSAHLMQRRKSSPLDAIENALSRLKAAGVSGKRPPADRMCTPSAVIAVRG